MITSVPELMGFSGDGIDLSTVRFTPELLSTVPRRLALKFRVLPIGDSGGRLSLAMAAPDVDIVDSLGHLLRRELDFRAADARQLAGFLQRLYGSDTEAEK